MIPHKFKYVSQSEKAAGFHRYDCERCSIEAHSPYGTDKIYGNCLAWPTTGEPGYWLTLLLAAIGITQRRYVRVKQWVGLAPICRCPQNAEAINTLWQWIGGFFARKH